jgi:pseudouridine synthase
VKPEPEKVVIALNKPAGYLSACFRGKEEGWLVTELVDLPYRLFPVGRLDRDSEGLLLLTNDGELANRLTHPRYEQEKEYEAEVDKPVRFDACERLLRGVELEDGPARAKSAKLVGEHKLRLVLTEGRKREVRRMIESLGLRVVHLSRTRIAGLRLGDLAKGKWRRLSEAEVRSTLQ